MGQDAFCDIQTLLDLGDELLGLGDLAAIELELGANRIGFDHTVLAGEPLDAVFEQSLLASGLLEHLHGRGQLLLAVVEQLDLAGQDQLAILEPLEPGRQVCLDLGSVVVPACEGVLDLRLLQRHSQRLDLVLFVVEGCPTLLDLALQSGHFHLFLGDQADIRVHLGNNLFQQVAGATKLELDRNRVLDRHPNTSGRALDVADHIFAEDRSAHQAKTHDTHHTIFYPFENHSTAP